jgi:urease accessory protein
MRTHTFVGCLLFAFSSVAFAHTGHGLDNVHAGFMHPFSGVDHLLVMLAIGLWAAKIGGKARWQLPMSFVSMMALGFILALNGVDFNGLETAIAASVMVMGLLLVLRFSLKPAFQFGLVGLFALFHGLAHGTELSMQNSFQAMLGMLFATGLLHGLGLILGSQQLKLSQWINATLGWAITLAGGYLLIS